ATGALGLFLLEMHYSSDLQTARTMAVNAVVAGEMFYLLNSRSIFGSVLNWRGLTGNLYVPLSIAACILLQILYTYSPPLQRIFGSTALSTGQWVLVAGAGALVFFAAEFEKWLHRRRRTAP